jgi:excisionase family DNA binding protein
MSNMDLNTTDVVTSGVQWLTADEAAQHLKVKKRTLLLWTRQGRVPAFALSGTKRRVWRYRRTDLDAAVLLRSMLVSDALSVLSKKEDS